MSTSGTIMHPASVGEPESTLAHVSLNDVMNIAGEHQTEPVCLSVLEPDPGLYSAVVEAKDVTGRTVASWHSEPMFGSASAAQEYAEDVIGPNIFALLTGFEKWC